MLAKKRLSKRKSLISKFRNIGSYPAGSFPLVLTLHTERALKIKPSKKLVKLNKRAEREAKENPMYFPGDK